MGKKRIATITPEGKTKKEEKKRQLVKSGKQHGRVTDMGQVALEEAEKIKEKEKELEKEAKAKAKKETAREAKKKKKFKKRGRRYLKAKKQIDQTKAYPVKKAVKLAKQTSISRFNGKIELHLNIKEKGLKRPLLLPHPLDKKNPKITLAAEKKFPLIHQIIGSVSTRETALVENLEVIINAIGRNNIKKAVLAATMGPGIKLDLTEKKK